MYELSLKKNSNERFENRNAQVKLQADYEASKQ